MDQQLDAFTQKRFELMIEMATKKLQQEMEVLKATISSLNSEIGSIKGQISRTQFQPQHTGEPSEQSSEGSPKVKIIDCRPVGEKREEFRSSSSKNAEPVKPRYGDYKPEDVSIEKFFYFGRK